MFVPRVRQREATSFADRFDRDFVIEIENELRKSVDSRVAKEVSVHRRLPSFYYQSVSVLLAACRARPNSLHRCSLRNLLSVRPARSRSRRNDDKRVRELDWSRAIRVPLESNSRGAQLEHSRRTKEEEEEEEIKENGRKSR